MPAAQIGGSSGQVGRSRTPAGNAGGFLWRFGGDGHHGRRCRKRNAQVDPNCYALALLIRDRCLFFMRLQRVPFIVAKDA